MGTGYVTKFLQTAVEAQSRAGEACRCSQWLVAGHDLGLPLAARAVKIGSVCGRISGHEPTPLRRAGFDTAIPDAQLRRKPE
jgi:hypothetical protein